MFFIVNCYILILKASENTEKWKVKSNLPPKYTYS